MNALLTEIEGAYRDITRTDPCATQWTKLTRSLIDLNCLCFIDKVYL